MTSWWASSASFHSVADLAHDHRWSGGTLCVGVTPLGTPDAAAILSRAREAVERGQRRGGAQVTMLGAPG
jgi:hypothetical protein